MFLITNCKLNKADNVKSAVRFNSCLSVMIAVGFKSLPVIKRPRSQAPAVSPVKIREV